MFYRRGRSRRGAGVRAELGAGDVVWDDFLGLFGKILNINGRTTIPYMIVWGALIVVFAHFVFPLIEKFYRSITPRTMNIACAVLGVFLALDIGISVLATARQSMRRAGNTADNALEVFLDKYYDDERMLKTYSNARTVQK